LGALGVCVVHARRFAGRKVISARLRESFATKIRRTHFPTTGEHAT
jgi:hypothetical protein